MSIGKPSIIVSSKEYPEWGLGFVLGDVFFQSLNPENPKEINHNHLINVSWLNPTVSKEFGAIVQHESKDLTFVMTYDEYLRQQDQPNVFHVLDYLDEVRTAEQVSESEDWENLTDIIIMIAEKFNVDISAFDLEEEEEEEEGEEGEVEEIAQSEVEENKEELEVSENDEGELEIPEDNDTNE